MMSKVWALCLIISCAILLNPAKAFCEEKDLVIAEFEGHPNNLGGDVGVYGSLEPDWADKNTPISWYYEPNSKGFDSKNVHSGKQSFRLVNALGSKKTETWGSFSMDLGPTTDLTVTPKKVKGKDVSGYKYLVFWVKGAKGGEKLNVLFRDSHAPSYMPQYQYQVPEITAAWQRIAVPTEEISKAGVDLTSLDNVGLAFGPDVGNEPGATIFVDDFAFTNK